MDSAEGVSGGGSNAPAKPLSVAVAMSGGVDSSVAAALLAKSGHEVFGLTLRLHDGDAAAARPGTCCAGRDVRDARLVADRIGIPHYVLDYEERFRAAVIDDFADAYFAGETPVPCVRCNERIKFRDLLETAIGLGADVLATGHYARRVVGPKGPELRRALDPQRDQSYFLAMTTRAQLERLRFPLGDLTSKEETRAIAGRLGLPVADKPDSQDICFVPRGGYANLLARLRPDAVRSGPVVREDGTRAGRHGGIERFTIGQRRGLGLGGPERLFVTRIDAAAGSVVVGPRESLLADSVVLRDTNWIVDDAGSSVRALARIRSAAPLRRARVTAEGSCARVAFDEPVEAPAPGQMCALYGDDGDRVLGGGWIASTTPADRSAMDFDAGAGARGADAAVA